MRTAQQSGYLRNHRRAEEKIHEVGIELTASSVSDDSRRCLESSRVAVGACLRDGVESIGNRYDSGFDWNRVTAKMPGISLAVPALVVG